MGQQLERGNVDLYGQPSVANPDGSHSTVDSRSYNIDGQEVLLPSVTPDGRHLSTDADIVAEYQKTGRHLGKFANPESATAYATQLHDDYAAGKYKRKPMPTQIPYKVTFPDGYVQQFTAPSDMSDGDVYQRAVQERSIKSGKIPTTFMAGAAPEGAQALTTAGASAAGYATGNPTLVGAAPALGRGARYLAEKVTGQDVTPTNPYELTSLAAQGVIPAVGPSMLKTLSGPFAQAFRQLPVNSVPQAVARGAIPALESTANAAEQVSPQAVGNTVGKIATVGRNAVNRVRMGVSAEDLKLLRDQIATGMRASTAARIVAGKDPAKAQALLDALRKGVQ